MSVYRRAISYFTPDWAWIALLVGLIGVSVAVGLLEAWPLAVLIDSVLTAEPKGDWVHRSLPVAGAGRQGRPGDRPRPHRHGAAPRRLSRLDGPHDDQLPPELSRHDAGPLRPLRQAPGARADLSPRPPARRRDLPPDHRRVRPVGRHGRDDRHGGRRRDAHRHDRHPPVAERVADARGVHGGAVHDLEQLALRPDDPPPRARIEADRRRPHGAHPAGDGAGAAGAGLPPRAL